MPPTPQSATDLEPHLRRCGYGNDQLAMPFRFDNVTVPVVAFAGRPWDSWSACIAVVDVDGDSRTSADRVKTLGAPTVFACHGGGVDWWAMGPAGPKGEPRFLAWSKVGAALRQEKDSLHPSRIYASKLRKPDSLGEQLWFFDAGLMPAVERNRGRTLTRLVEEVIDGLRGELGTRLRPRQAQEDVYRTVFWLLAAKILQDKRVSNFIRIELTNVDEVFDRIGRHHGETGRFPPFGKSGRSAIDAAAERIAACGSLADVSSESLAHVYENTLIDKTAGSSKRRKASRAYDIRKELGIHSTPSVLINHMLSQLWPLIEEIEPDDRHVFEPACGHAPFLTASMRWLRAWGAADASGDSHQYLRSHLHGLESEPFAIEVAKLALTLGDEPHGNRWALTQGDMFEPGVLAGHAKRARILLANPPYERFTDEHRRKYKRSGTEITSQTKAVEMLKRVLPALPPDSVFGLVVPQGVLYQEEADEVRKVLVSEFEFSEISLFADNLFEKGDAETAILLGRRNGLSRGAPNLRYRRVYEGDMEGFKNRLAFSSERILTQDRFVNAGRSDLRVPELEEIWKYLSSFPRLASLADIGQGLIHHGRDLPTGAWTVESYRKRRGVAGFADVPADLNVYGLPVTASINLEKAVIRRPVSGTTTGVGQVLLNYHPVSRQPWRLKPVIDRKGHAVTSSFLTIRPLDPRTPLEYPWCLLVSPLANAFAYCFLQKRNILAGSVRQLPVPRTDESGVSRILAAASKYLDLGRQSEQFMGVAPSADSVHAALLALDAEVLKLYDLPPRLERQLLDLFTGVERKGVGCEFRGYYPPGLDAYVPLHELISDDYARSTLGRFREAPRTVSPDVLAALRTAAAAYAEE